MSSSLLQPMARVRYAEEGYVQVDDLLAPGELEWLAGTYDRFLSGEIDCGKMRSDLGAGADPQKAGVENITQIMWPSVFVPELLESRAYAKMLALVRELLGEDMDFDFDMLINKAPGSATVTPWHQDKAYWIDLPDTRAASCWLALDEATLENGCMWFVPGSQLKPARAHRPAGKGGGALECDGDEAEGLAVPLKPGCCTFHDGGTLHYSRGNSTQTNRRALIVNFRPAAMIKLEREQGFDHGKSDSERKVRNTATT